MTDPLAIVRRRLVTQRLAGEPLADAAAAVRWPGAVQAQEFAEAKWSLAERSRDRTDAAVEAAFTRGEFIRTHVLRPTWHFVARDDVRWMLRLTRPRVHALNAYWYRKSEIDPPLLARTHRVIEQALAGSEPCTRAELADRLGAAGIQAAGPRLAYLLMHAELEELICSGPRRGKQQTYALLDDRVPYSPGDDRPRAAAVADLALRYFHSHGPATVHDFTRWSSLTVAETKAALRVVGDQLAVEDHHGTNWYASPTSSMSEPTTGGFLIPMYDETIVAYQDLRVVLPHPPPRAGLLDRAIVIDGRTHGSWKRRLARGSVVVEANLFGPLPPRSVAALEGAVARFAEHLGLQPQLTSLRAGAP